MIYEAKEIKSRSCLHSRVRSGRGHTALVVLATNHANVSLVTPSGSPTVLNQPVLLLGDWIDTVADQQDTVIELFRWTLGFVVHSVRVELERFMRCVDSDRNWADGGHRFQQGFFASRLNVNRSDVVRSFVGALVSTLAVLQWQKEQTANY